MVFQIIKVFAKHKDGYIFPIRILVKPWVSLKDGLQFVGYLKKMKDMKEVILTNEDGIIDSMSEELMKLFEMCQEEIDTKRFKIQQCLFGIGAFYHTLMQ